MGASPSVGHLNEGSRGLRRTASASGISSARRVVRIGTAEVRRHHALHDTHASARRARRLSLHLVGRISPSVGQPWGSIATRSWRSALRQRQRAALQHDRTGAPTAGIHERPSSSCTGKSRGRCGAHLAGRRGRQTSRPRHHERHPRADLASPRDDTLFDVSTRGRVAGPSRRRGVCGSACSSSGRGALGGPCRPFAIICSRSSANGRGRGGGKSTSAHHVWWRRARCSSECPDDRVRTALSPATSAPSSFSMTPIACSAY